MTLFQNGDVRWTVELGLTSQEDASSVWDTALWDTGLWSGYAPNYVDVTDYVIAVNTRYGARRFGTRMQTGRAYVTFDNSEGWFNPDFGADLPGDLDLRLGRWCRISAIEVPSNTTWVLFEGIIDTIDEVYLAGASDSSTRITVYDFASALALDDPPALASPVGAGELSSVRIARILDEFGPVDGGWPWRTIATGDHTMQASTLAQNRLEEAHRAAEAEGGAFYFENGRYATFRPFRWLSGRDGEFPRSTEVQMWPGRGLATDPELVDAGSEWTANQLRNDIQLARVGGSSVRVQNTQSQILYGARTFRRLNLENDNDSQVTDLANRYLSIYQWDYQRLESVTLRASTVDQAHNVFRSLLGDLVSATIPLTLRGWGYAVEAHIIGIEYTVTSSDWEAVMRLDQAFRQAPGDAGAFSDGYDAGYLIGGN